MENVRETALEIINKVFSEGGYSNLLLNEKLKMTDLNDKDRGLLTELVYGTIQYKITLDYYLEPFIAGKKLKNSVRNILRMALYQLIYLDRIPNHAVINEAVNSVKKTNPELSGFVNAVLRNITRTGIRSTNEIADEKERLSVSTSHPLWLVNLWTKQYGFETARKLCNLNNEHPHQFARLNLLKEKRENILKRLDAQKADYENVPGFPEAVALKSDNIANLSVYKDGFVNVQDLSSMIAAKALDPQEKETVLDVCAAPGGKSTHLAELMHDSGKVVSCDLYEHKINLIRYNARRLGLKSIEPYLADATRLSEVFPKESFDRVLVDVPCSGFGVIRRKPEIKYNRKPEDLDELVKTQEAIIDEAVKMVKPGGAMVYSTCTVNKKENEKMVDYILNHHPEFTLNKAPLEKLKLSGNGYVQLIDEIKDADCFFIACFSKNKV